LPRQRLSGPQDFFGILRKLRDRLYQSCPFCFLTYEPRM
jgi:hypothetical protein